MRIVHESDYIGFDAAPALTGVTPYMLRGLTTGNPPIVRKIHRDGRPMAHVQDLMQAMRTSVPLPRLELGGEPFHSPTEGGRP